MADARPLSRAFLDASSATGDSGDDLEESLREVLRARITSDECESIMRLVRSQLDVSLHRRLAQSV